MVPSDRANFMHDIKPKERHEPDSHLLTRRSGEIHSLSYPCPVLVCPVLIGWLVSLKQPMEQNFMAIGLPQWHGCGDADQPDACRLASLKQRACCRGSG